MGATSTTASGPVPIRRTCPTPRFHNNNDQPLAASVTPYVVIPQDFQTAGLSGGSVIAVIFNRKIEYAVYGDTGPGPTSLAKLRTRVPRVSASTRIRRREARGVGVTYIAFTGAGNQASDIENQAETATLGQQLATKLVQSNP